MAFRTRPLNAIGVGWFPKLKQLDPSAPRNKVAVVSIGAAPEVEDRMELARRSANAALGERCWQWQVPAKTMAPHGKGGNRACRGVGMPDRDGPPGGRADCAETRTCQTEWPL